MSELQISLLAIGALVVLAVYGYGALQQRRYRNRFGATFRPQGEDALYQGVLARQGAGGDPLDEQLEHFLHESADTSSEADELCATLEPETDYIAVLFASAPLPGAGLARVWARRFDFGKSLQVCGVRAGGGSWERVAAESGQSWDTLRVALQLVDRSGAVSEARLGDFRDLLRDLAEDLGAEVNVPPVAEAVAGARRLDAFCAEVDHMIGLNILPSGQHLLQGGEVARVTQRHGMSLQADGAFHLMDENGRTLFTLANFDGEPFQHHELEDFPVIGLSLQLDVPRVAQPVRRFDQMAALARALGRDLHAAVVDDNQVDLSDAAIAMIRSQVAAIEKKMTAYPVTPGSVLARRLFS